MIPNIITQEDNLLLTKNTDLEETNALVFSLNNEKSAPDPHGFNGFFYQHFWDIIEEDVQRVIL